MPNPTATPDPAAQPPKYGETPRLDSSQIFQGSRTVEIEHAGQRYTLRLTRENKLILTK